MTSDTRNRIVQVAMELFWEKGYSSTSIADVLQRSNANAGSLYHFFPGKQDLLIAVLQAYRSGIDEVLLQPAWSRVDDPIDKIFALLARYREFVVQTDCSYGCPIGSIALELHEPDPAVRELLAANFLAWIEAVQRCVISAGEALPARIDSRALAEFVLTAMEGAVMQARTFRDVAYFDRTIEQLRAYFDLLRDASATPGRRTARAGKRAIGRKATATRRATAAQRGSKARRRSKRDRHDRSN